MEDNLLKTCLYDKHVGLGALMSPFGGFIMPIQYTNITDEHNAVRNAAGMFDVSHMGEIFVSGPDADKFVGHVFTNDIVPMKPGDILYGMMLYPNGTVVDGLLVYKEFEPCKYLLALTFYMLFFHKARNGLISCIKGTLNNFRTFRYKQAFFRELSV